MELAGQAYVGTVVTLTSANTNYNLLTLIQALTGYSGANGMVAWLHLQATAGNAGAILIGDASMTGSVFGFSLAAAANHIYGPFVMSALSLANIWVRSASAGVTLSVETLAI